MSDQIILAWTVDVTNTSLGPTQAATKLGAVPLYTDPVTDPVLGANFGLTVASDVTATAASHATWPAGVPVPTSTQAGRALTLNMTTGAGVPTAPPPFPCHPRTTTPPVPPYPLRKAVTLPGSFYPSLGSTVVPTTMTQIPSLVTGTSIQFLAQPGVFYTVAAGTTATAINLTAAYTGTTANSGAFKEVAAPVALDCLAVFSTSDLDTDGVATVPAIPAGSGARIIEVVYNDSTGAGPFTAEAFLTGRRPAIFEFDDPSSVDVAEIVTMVIGSTGPFGNSIGQITLVELSDALPTLRADTTPGTGVGAGQGDNTFLAFTDAAQLLIDRALVYMPPSYFALAFQQLSAPQLDGDFLVTTDSTDVPTTEDQTSVLNPSGGDTLRFASQMDELYTTAAVTPKIVTLTEVYSGLDYCFTDPNEAGTNSNAGTKGNIGTKVINKMTAAMTPVTADTPTDAQLAGPLAQFVALEVAAPPPDLNPATVPTPTFLSGLYTRTLQLALAGVPITSATITFI